MKTQSKQWLINQEEGFSVDTLNLDIPVFELWVTILLFVSYLIYGIFFFIAALEDKCRPYANPNEQDTVRMRLRFFNFSLASPPDNWNAHFLRTAAL